MFCICLLVCVCNTFSSLSRLTFRVLAPLPSRAGNAVLGLIVTRQRVRVIREELPPRAVRAILRPRAAVSPLPAKIVVVPPQPGNPARGSYRARVRVVGTDVALHGAAGVLSGRTVDAGVCHGCRVLSVGAHGTA